jgi:hypothetical protein
VDSPVRDEDGVIIAQSLSIPLHIEEAAVTRRNGNGEHHLIRWPCVELGCALDHGMSGGPIFVLQPDGVVVACGVVTSGSSFAPEGVASLIYPALSIRLDTDSILGVGNTPSLLDCVRSGLVRDMAEAHKHVRSDGSWSTQPLSAIELQDLAGLPVGGAVVANTSETCAVEYLSDECLHLGRVNQHNGDDADYFLISEEVCQLLRESPIQGDTLAAKLRFLKAEQPHVWFLVGEQPFRLVVFAVEGDRHPPVKILTDAPLGGVTPEQDSMNLYLVNRLSSSRDALMAHHKRASLSRHSFRGERSLPGSALRAPAAPGGAPGHGPAGPPP